MKSLTLALLSFAAALFAGAHGQQPGPPAGAAFAGPIRYAFFAEGMGRRAGVQQPAQPQQPDEIPVTDAGAGPCAVDLTVTTSDGKPVYAVQLEYHAAYGFMGTHKLDMTVYTNAQGKARFAGIPAKVKNPPIEFHASKNDLVGLATMDPAAECQARHDIMMDKRK